MAITRATLDASLKEATTDRIAADVQFGPDLLVRPASEVLGNDVVHIQGHRLSGWRNRRMRMASAAMLALSHQLKVLWRIVGGIAVLVMDYLPAFQGASQDSFKDDSVFKTQPAANPNVTIAKSLVDMPTFIARMQRAAFAKPRFCRILSSCHRSIVAPFNIISKERG